MPIYIAIPVAVLVPVAMILVWSWAEKSFGPSCDVEDYNDKMDEIKRRLG